MDGFTIVTTPEIPYDKIIEWAKNNLVGYTMKFSDFRENAFTVQNLSATWNRNKLMRAISEEIRDVVFECSVINGIPGPFSVFTYNGSYYEEVWNKPEFDITKTDHYQHSIEKIETFETTKTSKKLGEHIRSEIKADILQKFKVK